MSDEPHLPGYTVVDDDPTLEPESPDDAVLVASSAGAGLGLGDAVPPVRPAATTVSSQTPQVSTQPTPPVPQSQQRQAEERTDTTAAAATNITTVGSTAVTPSLPERPGVDEFADPKIASLHAIFPDYDAALL
jgi:hypothetical protein